MTTRLKIRVLPCAPPQYHGRKGWATHHGGPYWDVTFESGGQALLHRSEFEEVKEPPAEQEPPAASLRPHIVHNGPPGSFAIEVSGPAWDSPEAQAPLDEAGLPMLAGFSDSEGGEG